MKESTDFKMKTLEEVKFPFANDEAIQNMLQGIIVDYIGYFL